MIIDMYEQHIIKVYLYELYELYGLYGYIRVTGYDSNRRSRMFSISWPVENQEKNDQKAKTDTKFDVLRPVNDNG